MKQIILILCAAIASLTCQAQTAKQVLDKCAAKVSNKSGVSASFTMESASQGKVSGEISVKGKKFHVSTPVAKMWFDGKTLWTYMKSNEEVSVTNPTASQLQVLNPYNFVYLYKQGYKYTMTKSQSQYVVHLTASDTGKSIKEMFITVDKKSGTPTKIKMLQKSKWTTFTISNFRSGKIADSAFSFNAKDYPKAEVIDLR